MAAECVDQHALRFLSLNKLTIFELQGKSYVMRRDNWLPGIGLGLTIVEGEFEGVQEHWLRWCDVKGKPLATSYERSTQQAQRAKREAQRAKKLAAKLKELGVDPDKL